MNKYFFICLCLFSLSLSFYRPLSKLNTIYPSDICYFKDTTANSAISNIAYVKGCPNNKKCIKVDNTDSYEIFICNSQNLVKASCSTCNNQFECISSDTCTERQCTHTGLTCTSTPGSTSSLCSSGQIFNSISSSCEDGREQKKSLCKTYDSSETQTGGYNVDSNAKLCGKNSIKNNGDNNYYIENTQWVYYGSVDDGEFVEQPEACKSGYALYFYGNTQLENPSSGAHKMFLRCVTVLDAELAQITASDSQSSCTRIKYKIGNGNELIYDLSNLEGRDHSVNDCDYLLMTKIEIFKKYIEEYDKVKTQCSDNLCGKDELMKWWYLYNNPREYLLYKDQTEVLDYLIQARYDQYTPETGKVPETTPVTEPVTITEDETTTEPETESSRFLNIKYFIFLLFGLIEL